MLMHSSCLGTSLRIPSHYKLGSCICNHLWTTISTSSLLWNWWPHCGFTDCDLSWGVTFQHDSAILTQHILDTNVVAVVNL